MTDLTAHFSRIPFLATAVNPTVTRLAGLTNTNYLVRDGSSQYVLRVPGTGTSEYIDRHNERVAARSAAAAGVNAELLFFDPSDGLMVTRFVAGASTMTPERFGNIGSVSRAGRAFRQLHDTATPFANDFKLFTMIDDYKALLTKKIATLPNGYDAAHQLAAGARQVLEQNPVRLKPSHCDPLCENFLDAGDRMYIVDYEYSGNNDPMWDLGDLSVEGGFTAVQDAALLSAYFGGDAPADQAARMVIYKAMCDLLWTLWGVIQHANANPVDNFWVYASNRFRRCQALMGSHEFTNAINVLERL